MAKPQSRDAAAGEAPATGGRGPHSVGTLTQIKADINRAVKAMGLGRSRWRGVRRDLAMTS